MSLALPIFSDEKTELEEIKSRQGRMRTYLCAILGEVGRETHGKETVSIADLEICRLITTP